ncbi:MAG: efflux RND transporter periplasmic adaptor subunit [Mangrovicoccus sp.]
MEYAEPAQILAPIDGVLNRHVSFGEKMSAGSVLANYEDAPIRRELQLSQSQQQTLAQRIAKIDGSLTEARRVLLALELSASQRKLAQAKEDQAQALELAAAGRLAKTRVEEIEDLVLRLSDETLAVQTRIAIFDMETELQLADLRQQELSYRLSIEALEEKLALVRLTSPLDGTVSYVNPRLADVDQLAFRAGTHVFSISPPNERWSRLKMTAAEAEQMRKGEAVIESAEGARIPAKIAKIRALEDAAAWEKERFEYLLSYQDPEGTMGIGSDVTCLLSRQVARDVIAVPLSFLVQEQGQVFLWKIRGGLAEKTLVETGRVDPPYIEITSGLALGDQVRRP